MEPTTQTNFPSDSSKEQISAEHGLSILKGTNKTHVAADAKFNRIYAEMLGISNPHGQPLSDIYDFNPSVQIEPIIQEVEDASSPKQDECASVMDSVVSERPTIKYHYPAIKDIEGTDWSKFFSYVYNKKPT